MGCGLCKVIVAMTFLEMKADAPPFLKQENLHQDQPRHCCKVRLRASCTETSHRTAFPSFPSNPFPFNRGMLEDTQTILGLFSWIFTALFLSCVWLSFESEERQEDLSSLLWPEEHFQKNSKAVICHHPCQHGIPAPGV